ncbi:MAG TPA: hypothetical protein VGQ56_22120 [Gemmatimonadaceae bacterium]|nr:hypothetical protein [Gemmatimonadaceae bacterium]
MSSRPRTPIRVRAPIWIGALLWLWCAAAGGALRSSIEQSIGASVELGVRAAVTPARAVGVEGAPSPKFRDRWAPTTGIIAATIETFVPDPARASTPPARDAADRPRHLTFPYDATGPPTAL